MNYKLRTDTEQATLEHLPHSPYFYDDTPHLSTARYSMSGYDPHDVEAKRTLDENAVQDNLWWYEKNQQDNLAVNLGQR